MDSSRLKWIDRYVGTPLVLVLSAWEWLLRALSPARARRGRDLSACRRIAIIKTVALGDLVQALPTIRAVRERFPSAHLTLIATPRVKPVVDGLPFVDEILYYDVFGDHAGVSGLMRFLGDVRRHNFDTWVELEHYYRFTTVMGYLSGAKVRVGFDVPTQVRKYLFTITAAYPTDKHELEAFYAIARVLGADESGMSPIPILVSDDDKRRVSEWLAQAVQSLPPEDRGRGLAVFHTTTSPVSVGRRWPTERWAELADKVARLYGLTIVLTGAPEDVEVLEQLAGQMAKRPLIAAGHLNLRQFSHLAATAQLMVSVDTGPLHVAAATDVPIVALFGPADMRKWRPYKSNGVAISAGLACSPCTTHYLGKISAKTCSDCMQGISVSDVLAAIETLPGGPIRVGSRDGDQ